MLPMLARRSALAGSALSFSINGPACVSAIFCICAGVGACEPTSALPTEAAGTLAVSVAAAAGLWDPRMNQPPAIPTSRQMTANTYACTLVHCSVEVEVARLVSVICSVLLQISFVCRDGRCTPVASTHDSSRGHGANSCPASERRPSLSALRLCGPGLIVDSTSATAAKLPPLPCCLAFPATSSCQG